VNNWPADRDVCYGVACNLHGTCQRYLAVDGNTNHHQLWRANCGPDHELYIPIKSEKESEK